MQRRLFLFTATTLFALPMVYGDDIQQGDTTASQHADLTPSLSVVYQPQTLGNGSQSMAQPVVVPTGTAAVNGDHQVAAVHSQMPLDPFTGKVVRNKVRMRLSPSLESPIFRELNANELLIVVGEVDDFYAIEPPKDVKAYVFRTFILDDVVEGDRVNVRLDPALEAPVIAQLHRGDHVVGTPSPLNSKWLEIAPPPSTRFYVSKEYIDKIGSPALMVEMEARKQKVDSMMSDATDQAQSELQKNYPDIHLDTLLTTLHTVVADYSDFPEHVTKAKELLSDVQESYLQKKIAYLESKASNAEAQLAVKNQQLAQPAVAAAATQAPAIEIKSHADAYTPAVEPPSMGYHLPAVAAHQQHEESYSRHETAASADYPLELEGTDWNRLFDHSSMSAKMAAWIPVEMALYKAWVSGQHETSSPDQFYHQQLGDVIAISGVVEPYSRSMKNKPGDYMLVSQATHAPIAYLYSTKVDLQHNVGQQVTIYGIKRPNYNFAFPAYFVVIAE